MADFAERLRELRKQRGLRQIDLAVALGVAQTTIANYERKLRFPDERMLGKLADFFSVNLDFLLGRSDVKGSLEQARESREPSRALSTAAGHFLEVLRGRGLDAATELVESASRDGMGVRQIYLDLLEPALKETGRLWEHGELHVAEEHAISDAVQRIMSRIFPARVPSVRAGPQPRCFAVAASSEQHAIGLRMVSDFLCLDGWDVLCMQEALSIRDTIDMLAERPPDLLAVSVTLAAHAAEAGDLIATIRGKRSLSAVRVIAGGQAFHSRPQLWQEIGADATAGNAESAVTACNRLVGRRHSPERGPRPPA